MSQYSIKDLETLSGIKAHTIRIWEQRFDLLRPKRTSTNIRYYDDEQMRKMLVISTLISGGMKISAIASMSDDELDKSIDESIGSETPQDTQKKALINQMISSGLVFDEILFDKAFSTAILRYGIIDTYMEIVYPMLVRIGLLWNRNDLLPVNEHFVSNLIKQKIYAAIDGVPPPSNPNECWILFLPEEENHEIGLLLSYYLLKKDGQKVIYLGQRVPYSNLKEVMLQSKAGYLHFFLVTSQSVKVIDNLFGNLKKDFPKTKVSVSGSKLFQKKIKLPVNFSWLNSPKELIRD